MTSTPRPLNEPPARAPARTPWWLLMMLPIVASSWVRELWAPDEPRYAQVARELVETGQWLVLHLCGALYPDKPPLLYWLSGLTGWLGGWSELWLRIPSLLATAATAWLVAVLARRWWSATEAAWAPALFLGTAMVTEIGGRLQIDPLLTVLCTAALVLLTWPGEARGRAVVLGGLCVGLAALAKGPVAFVNVGVPLLLWRWLGPRGTVARASRRSWLAAGVLSVGPVLGWAVAASMAEPRLVEELFYGQHVGRVTQADRHPGPPWKHLLRMPLLLLPWTTAVIAGMADGWRGWRRETHKADGGLLLAGLWLVGLLLFYSAIPPKRDLYLLAAYPAAALLAARWLATALHRRRASAWVTLPGPLLLLVVGVALSGAGAFTDELPGLWWRGPAVGLPLVGASVLALLALTRSRLRVWALSLLAGWCAFGVVMAMVVFVPMNELKSARPVAEQLRRRPEAPTAIPCVGVNPEGYRFYGDGDVPAVHGDDLVAELDRQGDQFLALVLVDDWEAMPLPTRRHFTVLDHQQVGGKEMVILGAADDGPHAE